MLNRHPRLHIPFESRFIPEFADHPLARGEPLSSESVRVLLMAIVADTFVQKGRLVPDPEQILARRPVTYAQLVDEIFSASARGEGKLRWGDKTPSYVEELDKLWRLFPGCRFVHLVRDGRDVACSLRSLSWGTADLPRAARDWRWKVLLARKMGAMVPANYLEIRYEDLVSQPEHSLRRICEFLDEPFDATMLDYPADAIRFLPEDSLRWHRSSVGAPDPALIGIWRKKMSGADLHVFENVASDALALFGYELTRSPRTLRSRMRFASYALLGRA